jgi:hypothetical protein
MSLVLFAGRFLLRKYEVCQLHLSLPQPYYELVLVRIRRSQPVQLVACVVVRGGNKVSVVGLMCSIRLIRLTRGCFWSCFWWLGHEVHGGGHGDHGETLGSSGT